MTAEERLKEAMITIQRENLFAPVDTLTDQFDQEAPPLVGEARATDDSWLPNWMTSRNDTLGSIADYVPGLNLPGIKQDVADLEGYKQSDSVMDAEGSGMLGNAALTGLQGLTLLGGMPGGFGGTTGKLGALGRNFMRKGSQLGQAAADRLPQRITAQEPELQLGDRVSTAIPTLTDTPPEVHSVDTGRISLDEMRGGAPDKFANNMKRVASYPQMPTRARNPDKIAEFALDHTAGNLRHIADNVPDEFMSRSANWYKGANALANDISNAYGVPIEAAGGVLARLSPKFDWLQNLEIGDRLTDIYTGQRGISMAPDVNEKLGQLFGGDVAKRLRGSSLEDLGAVDKAMWIRSFDEANNPMVYNRLYPEGKLGGIQTTNSGDASKLGWQTNDNVARAVSMLDDPSQENISRMLGSGHKIRNFYNNIVDPWNGDDVTMDTHAIAAAYLSPFGANSTPVGHNFGGKGSSRIGKTGSGGTYGLYADAYRQVADELGINPMELQSPTWETIRETFPASGKKFIIPKTDAIWKRVRSGDITAEQARDEIRDMFGGYKMPFWMNE